VEVLLDGDHSVVVVLRAPFRCVVHADVSLLIVRVFLR